MSPVTMWALAYVIKVVLVVLAGVASIVVPVLLGLSAGRWYERQYNGTSSSEG